jgi:hypothetical protein
LRCMIVFEEVAIRLRPLLFIFAAIWVRFINTKLRIRTSSSS